MPDLTLGNYEIDEDSNGDLVIKDSNDTVVFKYDDTAGSFKPQVTFDFGSNDISNVGSLNTSKATVNHGAVRGRNGELIDASKFDGADADARLDAALASVSGGAIVFLEQATYSDNRTINDNIVLSGVNAETNGTVISGDWSLSATLAELSHVNIPSTVSLNAFNSRLTNSNTGSGSVTVSANRAIISNLYGGSVTFESGSNGGVIDSSVAVSVTDNGTNTVGDIA